MTDEVDKNEAERVSIEPWWLSEAINVLPRIAQWNEWRKANPDEPINLKGAHLSGVHLEGAHLSEAHLEGAHLLGAHLEGADLFRAHLEGAHLSEAHLEGAHLLSALLERADLFRAHLEGAQLLGAHLEGAHLSGVHLEGADLREAHLKEADLSQANLNGAKLSDANLERTKLDDVLGMRLDHCFTLHTRFSPAASGSIVAGILVAADRWPFTDEEKPVRERVKRAVRAFFDSREPWSVLRKNYSGAMVIVHLALFALFLAPYVGRTIWWVTVSEVESRARDYLEEVREEGEASMVRTEARRLSRTDALFREENKYPVWQLLLGWNKGWFSLGVVLLLIFYNVARYLLVRLVAPLRDEEERTGWSPAYDDYGWMLWPHRFVSGLFWIAVSLFLWDMAWWLGAPVYWMS